MKSNGGREEYVERNNKGYWLKIQEKSTWQDVAGLNLRGDDVEMH
jgi:hypothetical protein